MTRFYYDTEFLEDGKTIELISIGIVREDGATYYAVNENAPWERIHAHDWLRANVVPHLPEEELWTPRSRLRDEVYAFLTSQAQPELWAWFAAYDHVVLSQLWGRMIDLPSPLPMYSHDLRSLVDWANVKAIPSQATATQHDALADARWNKRVHDYILKGQR